MGSVSVQDWVLWLTSAAIGLGGAALGAWALLWDRSRGRERCPKCWYSMEGAQASGAPESLACPECGSKFPASATRRTRRRWRWACAGAGLVAAGAAALVVSRARSQGWPSQVPTETLLWFVRPAQAESVFDPSQGSWVAHWATLELDRRVSVGRLSSDEIGKGIKRAAALRGPATWFTGRPLAVWCRAPAWLDGYEITATPRLRGPGAANAVQLSGIGCGNAMDAQRDDESFQIVGELPEGTRHVVFDVLARPMFSRGPKKPEWSGTIAMPVRVIAPVARTPDTARALTDAIRDNTDLWCHASQFGKETAGWVIAYVTRPPKGPMSDATVALNADLVRDGVTVASYHFEDPDEAGGGWQGTDFIRGEVVDQMLDETQRGRFVVHVRGVEPRDGNRWCRTRYWAGEYTVALSDVLSTK